MSSGDERRIGRSGIKAGNIKRSLLNLTCFWEFCILVIYDGINTFQEFTSESFRIKLNSVFTNFICIKANAMFFKLIDGINDMFLCLPIKENSSITRKNCFRKPTFTIGYYRCSASLRFNRSDSKIFFCNKYKCTCTL